jgi:hypothetical protein
LWTAPNHEYLLGIGRLVVVKISSSEDSCSNVGGGVEVVGRGVEVVEVVVGFVVLLVVVVVVVGSG